MHIIILFMTTHNFFLIPKESDVSLLIATVGIKSLSEKKQVIAKDHIVTDTHTHTHKYQ